MGTVGSSQGVGVDIHLHQTERLRTRGTLTSGSPIRLHGVEFKFTFTKTHRHGNEACSSNRCSAVLTRLKSQFFLLCSGAVERLPLAERSGGNKWALALKYLRVEKSFVCCKALQ